MQEESFNIWLLIAGLGVFLYSMYLLEQAIKMIGGDYLRNFIKKYTSNRYIAILTGTTVTAILQSSSAVSLMVLAFAGAGLIHLSGAIGVIIGSNLGTTITSWIIAGLGFKFSIEAVSLPFIGLGGIGITFLKKRKLLNKWSNLIFAFGLLLLGLGFMKDATDVLAQDVDLTHWGQFRLVFLLGGVLLAALMQSSSAAVLIAFSGLYSGIFDWDSATHIVMGTALGTTITVILGSITGGTLQKRIAASHFFFNLVTVILGLVLFPFYSVLILDTFGFKDDLVIGLALFHTFFKFVGVVLFAVILTPYTVFIERFIRQRVPTHTRYISNLTAEVPEAGIVALKDEVLLFQNTTLYFILKIFGLRVSHGVIPGFTHKHRLEQFKKLDEPERYEYLKDLQAEIYDFAYQIRNNELKPEEDFQIRKLLVALRYFMMAAKKCKDLSPDLQKINNSPFPAIRNIHLEIMKMMSFAARDFNFILEMDDEDGIKERIEQVDNSVDQFINSAIEKINVEVKNREIPFRERNSLHSIHNECHQVVIFFLEAIKNIRFVREEDEVVEEDLVIEEK